MKNLPQFRLLQSRLGPTQEAADRARLFGSPPPAHTTQHRGGKQENSNFTSALPLPAEGKKRRGISTTFPAHAGRQDSLKPRTSSSAPEALRSCARSPLPSFTSLSSVLFLSDIHLPGLFQIKPSHSKASLTMKKRWVFLFFGPPEDPPLGMTLPSLTAERTPSPAHRSRLPPPHPPAGGEDSVQAAAPRSARPSSDNVTFQLPLNIFYSPGIKKKKGFATA